MRPIAKVSLLAACIAALALPEMSFARPRERAAHGARRARHVVDEAPNAARWLGPDGIPLASTSRGAIQRPRGAACLSWGRLGEKYRAVDAWGKVVGHAEVRAPGSRDPDLNACNYPDLKVTDGHAGTLYVSEAGAWTPPAASAEWTPTQAERAGFEKLAASFDDQGPPLTQRASTRRSAARPAVFFKRTTAEGEQRLAVLGGRTLLVGRLEGGEWRATRVETSLEKEQVDEPYRVLGVMDMDGDGVPEIVFGWQSLDDSGQGVLQEERGAFRVVARSAWGTTA